MRRIVPVVLSWVFVSGCSSKSDAGRQLESIGSQRQGIDVLTNELRGQVDFTNAPGGTVATALGALGMTGGSIAANSQGSPPSPPVSASTSLTEVAVDRLSADYQLTVAAGNASLVPPETFVYQADAFLFLNLPNGFYRLPPSDPVGVQQNPQPPGPALPPVPLDLLDCAGLVNVTFSSALSSGRVEARHPAVSDVQAAATFGAGTSTQLPVRGDGSTVQIDVFMTTGTDPFNDTVTRLCRNDVVVGCDQVVDIACNTDGGGVGAEDLGTIDGNVEMQEEFENLESTWTLMRAVSGPFDNARFFAVPANPAAEFPNESSGHFLLKNLLDSDASIPVTGSPAAYEVFGEMSVRKGRRSEFFATPHLQGDAAHPNPRVPVTAGANTPLGDTFVMDPEYVRGDLRLAGPAQAGVDANAECLKALFRDSDDDPLNADKDPVTGLPNTSNDTVPPNFFITNSYVGASGVDILLPPAVHTAISGGARTLFEGDFDGGTHEFLGDYELVLGNLLSGTMAPQPARWQMNGLVLSFVDPQALAFARQSVLPTDDTSYQNSHIGISDNPTPFFDLDADGVARYDIHRCFSKVTVVYNKVGATGTSTGKFFDPRFNGSGTFAGNDFEGRLVNYNVGIDFANGMNLTHATAATAGKVVACLPQAIYTLNPFVTAINSNDSESTTQLPQETGVSIGCRQNVVEVPPIHVNLDLPACADPQTGQVTFQSQVISTNTNLPNVELDFIHVDTDAAVICSGGGPGCQTPFPAGSTFSHTITLNHCANTIQVSAQEKNGTFPSQNGGTSYRDTVPPAIVCPDNKFVTSAGGSGTAVAFAMKSVTDDCPTDLLPVVCTTAEGAVHSGSLFKDGVTHVTCAVSDHCNTSTCSFDVDVGAQCQAPPTIHTRPVADAAVCGKPTDQIAVTLPVPTACDGCQTAPATTIFSANFNANADGFTAADNLFRATTANGRYETEVRNPTGGPDGTGALQVTLGGVDNNDVRNMSGGWQRGFTLAADADVKLTFRYDLTQKLAYESDEQSQVLAAVDGVLHGILPNDFVDRKQGTHTVIDDRPGDNSTGWVLVTLELGHLGPGAHVLQLGGFNNKKTSTAEFTTILFDDVSLTALGCVAVPVTGSIALAGGGSVPVPASGIVDLSAGSYVVTWTATDSAGHQGTVPQTFDVVHQALADDRSCCPIGTNVIVGTNGDDVLRGTSGRDCILGLGGRDTISGFEGDDLISGGAGDDVINAGAGDDIVEGGAGRDTIDGSLGRDTINGGADFDICAADPADAPPTSCP